MGPKEIASALYLYLQKAKISRSIYDNVPNYNPWDKGPEFRRISKIAVIPAKAGIQLSLDSRIRGNDDFIILPFVFESPSCGFPLRHVVPSALSLVSS